MRQNKRLIVVEGYLASGKSTFARTLAARLRVPYLMKDTFKSALCENIPEMDRDKSSLFSAVTFDAMAYAAERLFEAGFPLILEGNFVPAGVKKKDEAGTLRRLIARYGYEPLTFWFRGDLRVLYERFTARDGTPERGRANVVYYDYAFPDFENWCRCLEGFDVGGRVVPVNTTDFATAGLERCAELAERFMAGAVS